MTTADLLLTEERQAQLTAALENLGVADPLAVLLAEAQADVARYTRGYDLDQASLDSWTRALTLYKAFLAAEAGIPKDIEAAYKDALAELTAIARGERPNLVKEQATPAATVGVGGWGSATRITLR